MIKSIVLVGLVFGICFGGDVYNRKEWKHWRDLDKDGQDTRQEVLVEENLAPLSGTLYNDGKIVRGMWICKFTGDTVWLASELDIDHLVPLKEAWLSGGDDWFESQMMLYANFLSHEDHLVAVRSGANRSKGAKDPSKWMPDVNKCWYLETWLRIKDMWELSMDATEDDSIAKYKEEYNCDCE